MRQTLLVVAALMLVLSAAAFAVAPVHALGSDCPGVQSFAISGRSGYGSAIAAVAPDFAGSAPYNPTNGLCAP